MALAPNTLVRALQARFLERTQDASGAIYGTLVTAGTLLGAAEGTHDVLEITSTVVVTLLLYWVAHGYATVLGSPHPGDSWWIAARHELLAESAMITACVVPVAGLLAANGVGASFETSTSIALWLAVVMLFGWGIVAAQRTQQSRTGRLLSGVLFGVLGLVIVGLKTLLVH